MSAEDMAKMPAKDNAPASNADGVDPKSLMGRPNVDNVAMSARSRLDEAGTGP